MAARYSRLFTLPNDLYASGSPVVIAAGALLKDNQTNNVLAQLKFRSISGKTVKALQVRLMAYDTAGRNLSEAISYQYLDLDVRRDEEFGQKTAVPLADSATRSFSVAVTEVVFVDNTLWTDNSSSWAPIPKPTLLSFSLGDAELVKQYKIVYGQQCNCQPLEHDDLWYCACGALNHQSESACKACGLSHVVLFTADLNELKEKRDIRLAEEKEYEARIAAEKARKEAEEKAAAAKRAEEQRIAAKKRNKIIRYCILITAILAAIAYFIVTMLIIPSQEYKAASALLTAGEYGKAEEAFLALGKFKDSQKKAEEARTIPLNQAYEAAVKQFEAAEYTAAEKAFLALGDHRDSAEWAEKARIAPLDIAYDAAVAEYNAGNYQSAEQNFLSLGTHRDSAEWAQKAQTARLDLSYDEAMALYNAGDYATAEKAFMALGDHKDSSQWAEKAKTAQMDVAYQAAMAQFEAKEYEAAEKAFSALNGYLDSVEWAEKAKNARLEEAYNAARKAYQKGAYEDAMAQFKALGNFRDSAEQVKNCAAAIERKKNQQASSSSSGSSTPSTPSSPTQTSTPIDPAVEQAIANMQGVWEAGNYPGSGWRRELIIEGNTIIIASVMGPEDHYTTCSIAKGTYTVTTNAKGEPEFLYTFNSETVTREGSHTGTYRYRTNTYSWDMPIYYIANEAPSDVTRRPANDTPLYDYAQEQIKLFKQQGQ